VSWLVADDALRHVGSNETVSHLGEPINLGQHSRGTVLKVGIANGRSRLLSKASHPRESVQCKELRKIDRDGNTLDRKFR
jgi:hypothetical protein